MTDRRLDYSPIIDRRPLKLPDGARIAVWVIVNVEEWDINEPMARRVLPSPQGVTVTPDVPNWSWAEYGLRVGFWRLKEVLDRHDIRATVSLNASVCDSYPQIVDRATAAGWEIMGHGFVQRVLNVEQDERAVIRRTIDTIRKKTGTAPRGWMGPGLAETFETPDILAEEGIEYVCDWVADDQPFPINVRRGSLTSIPYTLELNDIPIHIDQHHRAPELFERSRDQFDTLYREGADNVRVMAIAVHPYITGVPHRIGYFERIFQYIKQHDGVAFMTGGQVLDWYRSEVTGGPAN